MLKTVVQQMQRACKLFFRKQAGLIAIRAHDYRHAELAREQKRLITKSST